MNETYKEAVYTYAKLAALGIGILQVLVVLAGIYLNRDPEVNLTGAFLAVGGVTALMQAIGSLLVFPALFTAVSRKLGAPSDFEEVVGVTAFAALPTLLLLVLGIFMTPNPVIISLLSLTGMALFCWGLSQMNEEALLPTIGHTIAVWMILLVLSSLLYLVLDILF